MSQRTAKQTRAWLAGRPPLEELRAAHDATAPTDEEIEAAAAAGLLAPEGTALLDRIEAGYARAGLRFPATVRPAPATAPPTTPTTPP